MAAVLSVSRRLLMQAEDILQCCCRLEKIAGEFTFSMIILQAIRNESPIIDAHYICIEPQAISLQTKNHCFIF